MCRIIIIWRLGPLSESSCVSYNSFGFYILIIGGFLRDIGIMSTFIPGSGIFYRIVLSFENIQNKILLYSFSFFFDLLMWKNFTHLNFADHVSYFEIFQNTKHINLLLFISKWIRSLYFDLINVETKPQYSTHWTIPI